VTKSFWREKLRGDSAGLLKMLAEAETTNFNQFDGNQVLSREVGGRHKIGIMSIDQQLWSWAGDPTIDIRTSATGNLDGAWYLYKKFKALAWTRADKIHPSSQVISVPADAGRNMSMFARVPVGTLSGTLRG